MVTIYFLGQEIQNILLNNSQRKWITNVIVLREKLILNQY